MNANELADELEQSALSTHRSLEVATMLRQQQSEIERLIMLCDCMTTESNRKGNEIEALKQIIDANNLNQNIGQFVKPTNKPVAWRCKKFYETQEGWFYNENEIGEPLYTGFKELTDEEIIKVYEDMLGVASAKDSAIDFAKAILRKAQE